MADVDESAEVGRLLCEDGIHEADEPCCEERAEQLAALEEKIDD